MWIVGLNLDSGMIALTYLTQADVERLAGDRSAANRAATMLRVGEVLASGIVGPEEREIAYAIIDKVLPEAELEIRAELAKWSKLIKEIGIAVN